MPWCDDCGRFLNPNSVRVDGSCPGCGARLAEPAGPQTDEQASEQASEVPAVPWHFWMLLAAVIGYLGWRAVQGVDWLIHL